VEPLARSVPGVPEPSRAEIRAAVVSALLSTKGDRPGEATAVDDDTPIGGAGLGISSLNVLQAMVRIEDTLDIVFDDRTVAETPLFSVGTMVDLVERALAGKGQ
jgi:acyl carrier protein